jgi:hypothetical protein
MKKAETKNRNIRGFFSPGPQAYDEKRQLRMFVYAVLIGLVLAVGFGFALYYLNKDGRF